MEPDSVVDPGHEEREKGSIHDIYVEVQGPAGTDVHHNFVQRWNEASEINLPDGQWPVEARLSDLSFPVSLSPSAGEIPVQISRTVRRGSYSDGTPAIGAEAFPILKGEQSCLEQYIIAFDAAHETIYCQDCHSRRDLGNYRIMQYCWKVLFRRYGTECLLLAPRNRAPVSK
ncbi:MAG: hypothetical protein HY787_01045 [Deltaproteobacteria bacterium]|nr:hypothetical protein [Deltaproteobacteria bacterium]